MISEAAAWAIFFLPLASFVVIGLVIRPFLNRYSKFSGYLTMGAIGAGLALSVWALMSVMGKEEAIGWASHRWLTLGAGPAALEIGMGIYMDSLTAIMLVVVTGVSLMVQIYSQGYMAREDHAGYSRYFAFMSLFTASMIGLVLARNIVQLFVFWELVGLCSYLLIGFWYQRPSAAAAAKKAFIVTRVGDFGFLIAILYLFFNADTFQGAGLNPLEIPDIYQAAVMGVLGAGALAWLAGGLFAGAVGKSAQMPLHVWLPDAMEGPTPVSALIHAATMVAAGVFLVARFFPVFLPDPEGMAMTAPMVAVALVGGITAFVSASMGLVANDIKRVLAYSTISQLGYMMLALGVGAYDAAIFHLFNHAFFKALLFLGSGSVSHATGTFDMRYMGGLRRVMPWTYRTFVVASLSLAGFPFLAGWWSKDEILAHAFGAGGVGQLVYWLGLITAFMTAFYIFRVVYLTFHGEFRGGVEAETGGHGEHGVHLAESPLVMVVPLVLLAVPSVLSGFVANPPFDLATIPAHWFAKTLVMPQEVLLHLEEEIAGIDALAVLSSVVALAGIGLAYLMYSARRVSPTAVADRFGPLYRLALNKYYLDELYEGRLVAQAFYRGGARALELFDWYVVEGVVNGTGWVGRHAGRTMSVLQSGQVQAYGIGISVGIILILVVFLLRG